MSCAWHAAPFARSNRPSCSCSPPPSTARGSRRSKLSTPHFVAGTRVPSPWSWRASQIDVPPLPGSQMPAHVMPLRVCWPLRKQASWRASRSSMPPRSGNCARRHLHRFMQPIGLPAVPYGNSSGVNAPESPSNCVRSSREPHTAGGRPRGLEKAISGTGQLALTSPARASDRRISGIIPLTSHLDFTDRQCDRCHLAEAPK